MNNQYYMMPGNGYLPYEPIFNPHDTRLWGMGMGMGMGFRPWGFGYPMMGGFGYGYPFFGGYPFFI